MSFAAKRLIPTLNRILIRKIEQQTKTASGIILSEAPQEPIGEVIETGPGNLNEKGERVELSVKKGDFVLLPDYGGSKIKLAGKEYFVYRDSDILGKYVE